MKQKLLFAFLFLLSIQVFAQDQKWSVEANYGVVPEDGFGGDENIIDLGFKYRFVDVSFIRFGFGINAGYSKDTFFDGFGGADTESFYIQPRIFSEFVIPDSERLRPSIGLGYSIVKQDFEGRFGEDEIFGNTTDGGYNINVGLSYDITKNFFVQVQYDFINLYRRDEFNFGGEIVSPQSNEKLNNIKIGIGFRF